MIGSLSLVVWLVDPAAVMSTMASANPTWLAGAVAFAFLCPAIAATVMSAGAKVRDVVATGSPPSAGNSNSSSSISPSRTR